MQEAPSKNPRFDKKEFQRLLKALIMQNASCDPPMTRSAIDNRKFPEIFFDDISIDWIVEQLKLFPDQYWEICSAIYEMIMMLVIDGENAKYPTQTIRLRAERANCVFAKIIKRLLQENLSMKRDSKRELTQRIAGTHSRIAELDGVDDDGNLF